jgi:hypothetical protein
MFAAQGHCEGESEQVRELEKMLFDLGKEISKP